MSKGQTLMKNMVNAALDGDQRMLVTVLKLLDRLEAVQEETPSETHEHSSRIEWENLFAFYGKYRTLIDKEIERLKKTNPSYWTFDWFHPTLESAPWYEDVHGR